jgi:hypothetical protein
MQKNQAKLGEKKQNNQNGLCMWPSTFSLDFRQLNVVNLTMQMSIIKCLLFDKICVFFLQ